MAITFSKKYLSIYLGKMIPQIIRDNYPLYEKFIKTFLEFLEQDNNIFYFIENFTNFVDVDYIASLKSGTPEQQVLADKIIYELYEQMVGSKGARYISELMDEDLFLKKQKSILKYKGTKYAFLYFFLLILGGYFKILNVDYQSKKHDGIFLYNGLITYDYTTSGIDPYVYIIISNFYPTQYEKILNALNPAGMFPIPFYINLKLIDDSTFDSSYVMNHDDVYIVYYNDTELIGMIKPQRMDTYIETMGETYDVELVNNTRWIQQTSSNHVYLEATFNVAVFGDVYINNFKIVYNPSPKVNHFYRAADITSIGTVLYDTQSISDTSIKNINNIRQQIMINYL